MMQPAAALPQTHVDFDAIGAYPEKFIGGWRM